MGAPLCFSKRYVIFTITLCIASSAIGGFFAVGGQGLYAEEDELFNYDTGIEYPLWVGACIGVISGLLIGVLYICKLINLIESGEGDGSMVLKGSLWGIVAGVVCSTLVHTVLIIMHKGNSSGPFIWGAIFGAIAGLVLGVISSGIFTGVYNK